MARQFAQNEFIVTLPFDKIEKKLRILLDYNFDPMSIVQSLYVFACSDQVFISRLERIRSLGIRDIPLSLMKYTEDEFEEYIDPFSKYCIGTTNRMPYRSIRQLSIKSLRKIIVNDNESKAQMDKTVAVDALQKMLSCAENEAVSIYYNFVTLSDQLDRARECIDLLVTMGIPMDFIVKHPLLIFQTKGTCLLSRGSAKDSIDC